MAMRLSHTYIALCRSRVTPTIIESIANSSVRYKSFPGYPDGDKDFHTRKQSHRTDSCATSETNQSVLCEATLAI